MDGLYQRHGIQIVLSPGDYEQAEAHAKAAMALHADTPNNTYWTSEQLAVHGYLAEIGFRRLIGESPYLPFDMAEGGPDVCGIYQVKSNAWVSPHAMDTWLGGGIYVPCSTRAPVVVLITMFARTLRREVFYDGWIYTQDARQYPLQNDGRPAYRVPYMALNPPDVRLPQAAGNERGSLEKATTGH
jgi:hypothetical protein